MKAVFELFIFPRYTRNFGAKRDFIQKHSLHTAYAVETLKCRTNVMLAQEKINQPNDILVYLFTVRCSFQPWQLAL